MQPLPLAESLERVMEAYSSRGCFCGSVLVGLKGEILLKKGYGLANVEFGFANSAAYAFRIASFSKAFTAQAVLALQEQGRLHITDRLVRHIPAFPHKEITIEHLLAHTSGLDDASFSLASWQIAQRHYHTAEKRLESANKPLLFAPGSRFMYSNLGYMLLAALIERCSGKSYAAFLEEQLFRPLGMDYTGNDDGRKVVRHLAAGYSVYKEDVIRAEFADMSYGQGAFSLYSTVEDLYLWYQRHVKPSFRGAAPYSFGWGKDQATIDGTVFPFYWLAGDVSGYTAYMVNAVDQDACIIVLSNIDITPVAGIAKQLAHLVLGGKLPFLPPQPQQMSIEPPFAVRGIYRSARSVDTRELEENKLLSRLEEATAGDIANGMFLRDFELLAIDPSETFLVLESRNKPYLFIRVRFRWIMLELIPVAATNKSIVYTTSYYDGRLELSGDGRVVRGNFTYPDGKRLEALTSIRK
ncbi:MAG: beta-lactamase family protein [Paenibacillaceae bacterium]|nr:beta-lactamase family protein [Paenibacillaceae bacterium]